MVAPSAHSPGRAGWGDDGDITARVADESLLAGLRAAARFVGGPLTTVAYERARAEGVVAAAATTIANRFGGWAAALTAAGVAVPPSMNQRWDRPGALAALAAWCDETASRRYADYAAATTGDVVRPSPEQLRGLFGGWTAALAQLDLAVPAEAASPAAGVASRSGFRAARSVAQVPALGEEWHPTRNDGLDPATLGARTSRVVWWRCVVCGHEWVAAPMHRARNLDCPRCAPSELRPRRSDDHEPVPGSRPARPSRTSTSTTSAASAPMSSRISAPSTSPVAQQRVDQPGGTGTDVDDRQVRGHAGCVEHLQRARRVRLESADLAFVKPRVDAIPVAPPAHRRSGRS